MKPTISIDPSKNSTGILIATDDYHQSFTMIIDEKDDESVYFVKIANAIKNIIKQHKIEAAIIEDYAFSRSTHRSFTILAEIKGIILLELYKQNLKVIKIGISSWKTFSKIYETNKKSKKGKANYINQAFLNYGLKFNSTDEVDAYLMLNACHKIFNGLGRTDSQLKLYEEVKYIWED